jgi:hypothetical protein
MHEGFAKGPIDPQLERAGWHSHGHSTVREEIPVDGYDAEWLRAWRQVHRDIESLRRERMAPPFRSIPQNQVQYYRCDVRFDQGGNRQHWNHQA